MKKCGSCKYWGIEHPTAIDTFDVLIDEKQKSCGCPKIVYLDGHNLPIDGLGYLDGEGYQAALVVGAEFGCIHHAA